MVVEKTPEYSIYQNKDGRLRVYVNETKQVVSYPKFLMEKALGRKLSSNEEVHHIDGDYTNNNLDNLAVLSKEEHLAIHKELQQKYHDKEMICPICGKTFI